MRAFLVCCLAFAVTGAEPAFAGSAKLRECWRGTEMDNLPLVWRPTEEISQPNVLTLPSGVEGSAPVRIEIRTLTETRTKPKRIGENRGDFQRGCIYAVTTRDDASVWVTDRLRYILKELGFAVVENDGDVILSGELRQFFVTETGTYAGEVAFKLDVTSKAGKPVWSGVVRGTNGRFGRSYKIANYYETLSDALIDAVQSLTADSNFALAVWPNVRDAAEKRGTP